MRRLRPAEFERDAAAFDAAVDSTPGVDPFCSSSDWILSCLAAWGGDALFLRGDAGYLAFRRTGAHLLGLDAMWEFSCPIASPAPLHLLSSFDDARWRSIAFPGVVEGSETSLAIVRAFDPRRRVLRGPPQTRVRASLFGGLDGFLSRRSAKFRKGLRESVRRAAREGVEVLEGGGDRGRMLAVEARSWKGPQGEGLLHADLAPFYAALFGRLADRGALRVLFARRGGEDLAYIAGGVRGSTYRGFQFSYDRRFPRLGLGNLLQREQILRAAGEGVSTYDLGLELPYKLRWGEERFETCTLAVV